MPLRWSDIKVAKAYIKSIRSSSDNEINITKKFYHDPFFYNLLPEKEIKLKNILDVGCGNGYMLQKLSKKYPEAVLYGTDLQEMFKSVKPNKRISFVASQSHALPFNDSNFDLVISSLVYHWIEKVKETSAEIFRVLKPRGNALISLINPLTFHVGKWQYNN